MDGLSAERRSSNMRQIRSKDRSPKLFSPPQTAPQHGYRFLLHQKDLPGKPATSDANYAFARTAPFLTDGPRRASAIAAIS
jgi:G:T-mismatch repair DNA endonuclease (very short patch repair protein)